MTSEGHPDLTLHIPSTHNEYRSFCSWEHQRFGVDEQLLGLGPRTTELTHPSQHGSLPGRRLSLGICLSLSPCCVRPPSWERPVAGGSFPRSVMGLPKKGIPSGASPRPQYCHRPHSFSPPSSTRHHPPYRPVGPEASNNPPPFGLPPRSRFKRFPSK